MGRLGDGCRVNFSLDGFLLTEPREPRRPHVVDLDALALNQISGVEVYSEISTPVQYKPMKWRLRYDVALAEMVSVVACAENQ